LNKLLPVASEREGVVHDFGNVSRAGRDLCINNLLEVARCPPIGITGEEREGGGDPPSIIASPLSAKEVMLVDCPVGDVMEESAGIVSFAFEGFGLLNTAVARRGRGGLLGKEFKEVVDLFGHLYLSDVEFMVGGVNVHARGGRTSLCLVFGHLEGSGSRSR
jgi:hypothetical protein